MRDNRIKHKTIFSHTIKEMRFYNEAVCARQVKHSIQR